MGIGTATPNPRALLDLRSTDKGFLLPRLTTSERTALGATLAATDDGLQVYDTDGHVIYYWDGNALAWVQLNAPGTGLTHAQNGLSISGVNAELGGPLLQDTEITTDDYRLTFNVDGPTTGAFEVQGNGQPVIYVPENGNIGLHTTSPIAPVHSYRLQDATSGQEEHVAIQTVVEPANPSSANYQGLINAVQIPAGGGSLIGATVTGQAIEIMKDNNSLLGQARGLSVLAVNNQGQMNTLYGGYWMLGNNSSGSITAARVLEVNMNSSGSGAISDARGVSVGSPIGIITNYTGLYVEEIAAPSGVKRAVFYDHPTLPFVVAGDGRVGIGTISPAQPLHVAGNFRLENAFMPGGLAGTTGDVLVSQGPGVAPAWNNPSNLSANRFLSNLQNPVAVNQHLTPFSNDVLDIGSATLGWRNLYATGGYFIDNTLFLTNRNLTTGTFVGNTNNTTATGANTTAVGFDAGRSLTTGTNNTFVGHQSGRAVTAQSFNTFVGSSAGRTTTQSLNTLVGALAGETSSGTENTFLGVEAGAVASGNQNVFVGRQAGYTHTTGSRNLFLGYGAGQVGFANTTGTNNTFIGYAAGLGSATQRTNATAIGYSAKVDSDNALVLGGTGANAVRVGIGQPAPAASAVLDITSTDKGVLFPRLTEAQRDAISSPANGLHVYNIETGSLEVYNSTFDEWVSYIPGGTKEARIIRITANTSGFNLMTALGSPTQPMLITVIIEPGVTVNASAPGGTAFNTGIMPTGSKVKLINRGAIRGGGGNGGVGADLSGVACLDQNNETSGAAGGNAIITRVPITIENYGTIAAGGGGGGGGGGIVLVRPGGGGGGGAGSPAGFGGPGGTSTGLCLVGNCVNGIAGTLTTGGAGGACGANDGGTGGGLGAAGTAGVAGAVGGPAGLRVKHFGNSVVFSVVGTTFGVDGP